MDKKNTSTTERKENVVTSSIYKSLMWSLWTVFFGLLQVWLTLATTGVETAAFSKVVAQFNQLLVNGALLFFSTAIVSSLTIDRLLRTCHSDTTTIFWFIFIPFVIIVTSVWLFTMFYGERITETTSLELLKSIQIYGVFSTTLIYAFFVKFFTFKEIKGCKK